MLPVFLTLIDEPNDNEKFDQIYSEYRNKMYYKALSMLRNPALAEEAVQESLLKIAENISKISLKNRSQTASFIVIIVRNTCLNMLKSERDNEKDELDDKMPDISMDVLGKIMSNSGYDFLVQAVDQLESIYSDVLMLKAVMGYSCEEISKLLGIPRKTVDTRIYRAKKLLKERLETQYEEV